MMRFAEQAAPWFETAEIIELHHDRKIDAAVGHRDDHGAADGDRVGRVGDRPHEHRGLRRCAGGLVENAIRVHSVRLRGVIASQEVLLGTTGQTLSIRHDTFDRSSFMPGVLLGVRRIAELDGLTLGLDGLLDP